MILPVFNPDELRILAYAILLIAQLVGLLRVVLARLWRQNRKKGKNRKKGLLRVVLARLWRQNRKKGTNVPPIA